MRIWLLFLLTILFSGHTLRAQLPKLWDKSYGGSSGDVLHTILPLTNGNLVIGGYSDSDDNGSKTVGNYGDYDYYIVCTDSSGNQLWDAGFGGNDDDVFAEVIQTTDGGFLLGGHSYSGNSGTKSQGSQGQEDYWVVKTSASGTEEWDKRFGGTASDYLTSVCATSDGGYLLGGYSESGANGDKSQSSWGDNDFWVVKIDGNGTKIWDKRFGGTDDDYCRFVFQTTDGGYLLAGYSNSSSNGDKSQSSWGGYDYWVVKIDGDGIKEWDKRFGTTSSDYGMGAAPDGSDGVVVGGYTTGGISGDKTQTNYGDEDFWLIRVDATGTKVWDKRFGGNDTEHDFGNVFRTSDGGYLATGNSYSPVSGSKSQSNLGLEQTWMLKCDANGSLVGDQTLLTNGHEEIGFTAATQNGCILLGNKSSASTGGDKTQSTHGSYDYFIAKYCLTDKPVANFSVPDTTICQTQCITFNDGSYNYPSAWSWSFPGGFPATSTQQNPQVCYNYNGIYDVTLIVTNWTGSDTILLPGYINVSALVANPVITQNGTLLTCSPAFGYQWYFNYVAIPGATNQSYEVTQAGLYSVVVSSELGCNSVSPAFNFSFNYANANYTVSDTLICENSCISFTDLSLNTPTGWLWLFPGASPASSTQQNPASVCYANPGIYPVTLTASNTSGQTSVTNVDYIQVVANPPFPVITQEDDTLFCNTSSSQYQWMHDGVPVPGATNFFYIMPASGNYGVEITNGSGCSASSVYDALVDLPGFAAMDSMVCEKFCTSFTDASTNAPVAWNWYFEGGEPAYSTLQNPVNICYNVPGYYDVTLVTWDGTEYDTLVHEGFITVFPTPSLPVITINGDTLISSNSYSYQWLFNQVEIPGATNQKYVASQSGVYTVIVESKDGCTAQVSLFVSITGTDDIADQTLLEIFPNPGSGIFHIRINHPGAPAEWYVSDVMGRMLTGVLQTVPGLTGEMILDLSDKNDGLYFIHACYADGCVVQKLVKHGE